MSCHHGVPSRGRGADTMARTLVSVGLCLWAGWVQAAPIAWTLDANMTRFRVPVATNTEFSLTNNPFQSDSLARSASGTLYSADPVGMIWDVTNGFQIPVGPTSRMMIGDLVMGVNGLWGFSNASQELFFFDFGTSAVTYAQTISGVGGSTITGVAYEGATGDVYLSGNTGLNTDTLYVVPTSSGSATSVGPMANGDALSYFSDIEFDASGTLYAMCKKVPATKSGETGRRGNSYIAHIWWLTPFSWWLTPFSFSGAARCGSSYAATGLVIRHEAMMGGIGARPKASAIPVPCPLRRMRYVAAMAVSGICERV